ncbi:hypothetical protein [Rubrivivax rivuli]|uniref:Uncharacterized protein n=1 Tax=Rubrivivax rivuli TaxID=1862385 RepID=A0A437RRW3_9BURK|nr:hypothetical protein [Rubrivivax rivuli]RVU49524.1 hypothetical protein EOE66_02855 [Rubrivivax rivuli]
MDAPAQLGLGALDGIQAQNGGNGLDGDDGLNSATVYLFQRTSSSTPPALPSANVTYTFGSGAASGVNNGWVQSLPTSGGSHRWVTTATALSTGSTDTILPGEWAAASLLAEDGLQGPTGNKVVRVYRRSLNAPSAPVGDGVPSGWSVAAPGPDGTRLWMSESEQTTAGVVVVAWSAPVLSDATPGPGPVQFGVTVSTLEINNGVAANSYVRLNNDGTFSQRVGAGGSWLPAGNWHWPTTVGIGASFRVRTVAAGDMLAFGILESWVALSTEPIFRLEQAVSPSAYAQKSATLQHFIAATGVDTVLATGYSFLDAAYDPAL